MALFVYVDNSNLWIEGMRISAVRTGLATTIQHAIEDRIVNLTWAYDFGKLYGAICHEGSQVGRASLFGSRPPDNDSLWALAETAGFEVAVFDRNPSNSEKEVDSAINTQMMEDSYEFMSSKRGDRAVLVAGDRDYLPPIKSLARRGLPTAVVFWRHATARALKEAAADYFALDSLHEHITLHK